MSIELTAADPAAFTVLSATAPRIGPLGRLLPSNTVLSVVPTSDREVAIIDSNAAVIREPLMNLLLCSFYFLSDYGEACQDHRKEDEYGKK
jgi:hypothetical protein